MGEGEGMDDEIKKLLTRIAELSPRAADRDDDINCFYCGAWIGLYFAHEEDCIYINACKIVNVEPEAPG
jgi:hypothetical protein